MDTGEKVRDVLGVGRTLCLGGDGALHSLLLVHVFVHEAVVLPHQVNCARETNVREAGCTVTAGRDTRTKGRRVLLQHVAVVRVVDDVHGDCNHDQRGYPYWTVLSQRGPPFLRHLTHREELGYARG